MTAWLRQLATYRPVWAAGPGERMRGPDEDVVTLAVAAAWPVCAGASVCAGAADEVQRVVLVTRTPDRLEPDPGAAIYTALALPRGTPVEQRLGGGPAALSALAQARSGTLVIAVSPEVPAGAAAALTGADGVSIGGGRDYAGSLPAVVRPARAGGARGPGRYDDPRLVRERGTRVAASAVLDGHPAAAVTGVGRAEVRRLGADAAVLETVPVGGAAEPLFALAEMVDSGRSGPLIALEGAGAAAIEVGHGEARVTRTERAALAPPELAETEPAAIPISLAAYARAFEAKVGLLAGRCVCGELSYPPRALCLACGRVGASALEPLPRTGEVYTTVTVRTPVPGIPGPYSLAIVSLDGVDLRVLSQVTGAPAASARIGDRGELVLRRIAVRGGVPDYGYAFLPEEAR